MSVVIKETMPATAVSMRAVVTSVTIRSMAAQILPEVNDYVRSSGIETAQPFLRYHRFDGHEVMMEAGYIVDEPLAGSGRIQVSGLPGGAIASFRHQGVFSRLLDAYGTLQLWMEANQVLGCDAPWEIYRDPAGLFAEKMDDEPVDVDLCWPVRIDG